MELMFCVRNGSMVWVVFFIIKVLFLMWYGEYWKKFSFKLLNWLRKDIIMNKLFYIGYILNIIFIVIIG